MTHRRWKETATYNEAKTGLDRKGTRQLSEWKHQEESIWSSLNERLPMETRVWELPSECFQVQFRLLFARTNYHTILADFPTHSFCQVENGLT